MFVFNPSAEAEVTKTWKLICQILEAETNQIHTLLTITR